ncbi:MAG: nicotinate-nucleotide--dimethylbenzimidazole phosphoribosyltransferase [Alphaproteobacteria bacterium]
MTDTETPANPTRPPLDPVRELIAKIPGPDEAARAQVVARDAQLTKPPGALGRLEDIAAWLAAWQGHAPRAEACMVAIFAGNHGVAQRGVAPYPPSVTAQMVQNFRDGGAAINQLCAVQDAGLKVFELALDEPTGDITKVPAMDETTCAATIAYGREAVADGADVLCLGEMGIANTTIAAALSLAIVGGKVADWAGPGTGATGDILARKIEAVETAVTLHKPRCADALEILTRLGGREFAAIVGAILAARYENIPVILDGYGTTAAAAVLHAMNPQALDHCIAGHRSAEPAHGQLLEHLGLKPLLDLGLRLGEGTGAALALGVVRAAAKAHTNMATFDQAGVSEKDVSDKDVSDKQA